MGELSLYSFVFSFRVLLSLYYYSYFIVSCIVRSFFSLIHTQWCVYSDPCFLFPWFFIFFFLLRYGLFFMELANKIPKNNLGGNRQRLVENGKRMVRMEVSEEGVDGWCF